MEDESLRLKVDDIMLEYDKWCILREVKERASRTTLGHLIKLFFDDPALKIVTKNKIRRYAYAGMRFAPSTITQEIPVNEIVVPPNTACVLDGDKFKVSVTTDYKCDGDIVYADVVLNTEDNSIIYMINDQPMENMKQYGFYDKSFLCQGFVDGIHRAFRYIRLCVGMDKKDTPKSVVPEIHTWQSISVANAPTIPRLHSKNCLMVLNYNGCKSTLTCEKCDHDLKQIAEQLEREQEEGAKAAEMEDLGLENMFDEEPIVVTDDEEEPEQESPGTSGFKKEEGEMNQISDGIYLCSEDEKDLLILLKKVIDLCPEFETLLRSQLAVAEKKDPRGVRWDPDIISWCLNMWAKSPNAYSDLKEKGYMTLPSARTLRYHKNKIVQETGINHQNLVWMLDEAKKLPDDPSVWHGMLLLDEMSIQQDLQICKRKDKWQIVGAVDLGPLVNNLEQLKSRKKEVQMASHCFQYLFVSFGGFRWPVAYYGSHNVNGHSIYLTLWPLVNTLKTYGFHVHTILMDGSSNNRQFTRLMVSMENARLKRYTTINPFNIKSKVVLMQDIKHVFKKIRNSLLTSCNKLDAKRTLILNGKMILWEHFQEAHVFNNKQGFRIYRQLTKEHMCLNAQLKMRNHLAIGVLNKEMLNLMQSMQKTWPNGSELDSTIELLKHTSQLVDIFEDNNSKVENIYDCRMRIISEIIDFFHQWEKQHPSSKAQVKHLITRETRQDIDSSLYGFLELVKIASSFNISLIPGYINSDTIENYFCQHRGLRNGFNQNPTLLQIGPATNSNLITGSVVSRKSNTGGKGIGCKGVMPPTKKFKKSHTS